MQYTESAFNRLLMPLKFRGRALPVLVLRKVFGRIFDWRTMILFSCRLPPPASQSAALDGVVIHAVEHTDAPVFGLLCERFPLHDFPRRLLRGDRRCHVAMVDGAVAGFAWTASGELLIDEIEFTYQLHEDELFIYDCFVAAPYRGRGIYPAMLKAVLRSASETHPRPSVIYIASMSTNPASLKGIRKAGFYECCAMRHLRCGRLRRWWGTTADASGRHLSQS